MNVLTSEKKRDGYNLWAIARGDTLIFNKNFFDRKFFKTGPGCAEGSIWLEKNKTSPLKKS